MFLGSVLISRFTNGEDSSLLSHPLRVQRLLFLAVLGLAFLCGKTDLAKAQSAPPLAIPEGGPPPADPNDITFNGWLLRGAVDTIVQASNNYLLTSPAILSGLAAGVSPNVAAEWSNGIHTTDLSGSFEHLQYRTTATNDGEATIQQIYAPLRDVTFSFLGDYTHQTITNGLTNSIPTSITPTSVGTTILPNGNQVLPNGTIVSPTGQIVGQSGQNANVNAASAINPDDQFTGTITADKIFNGGTVSVSGSLVRTNYEEAASQSYDYTAKTLTADTAFWLGPLLYAYSDSSYSLRTNTNPYPDSSAYRAIAGLGTGQFGFVRASAYAGYQGSDAAGSGSAGGVVYGGSLSYDPALNWNLSLNFDETANIASQTAPTTQALSLPAPLPIQIPLTDSTDVSTVTFRSQYLAGKQWIATGLFGFASISYPGSSRQDNAWLADAIVQYELFRNLTLTWEYQYASILSNAPGFSANRQLAVMRASYNF